MTRHGLPIAAITLLGLAAAGTASAQSDPAAMARRTAANQLGVLEYCQNRNNVGADAVAAQKNVIAHLPTSTAATDDAEATGRQGSLVLPDGGTQSLAAMASRTGTTVPALCSKLGESATRSAAMYRNGAMPGMPGGMSMPSMPGNMAMPSMPNGMSMPSMPGAPAAAPSPPS